MEEADKIYTGTYSAQDTAKVNSSFVISIDDGPGLKLEQWASDSQDISQVVKALNGIETPDIQLYPTRLQQKQMDVYINLSELCLALRARGDLLVLSLGRRFLGNWWIRTGLEILVLMSFCLSWMLELVRWLVFRREL